MSATPGRRSFLKFAAALAASGAMPDNLKRALAIAPNRATGTIQDVEHVVILMQENRSFDHYFGCLNGVRGYGDPRAERRKDGHSVFAQPDGHGKYILPFQFETAHTSSACLASLDHSWKGTQAAWNDWDIWIARKTAMTMGHFTRTEIPYYYALADAFTICDAYHASIFGPTNPNRLYFFTGTSGLAAGDDGKQVIDNVDDGNWTADMALDHPDFKPFGWETYPERLQKAGVTWRVYQEYDNFGDNPLASFAAFRKVSPKSWQYRQARQIVPGSTHENKDTSEGRYLVQAFEHDIANGTLPQVSWIVPPTALTEHPNAPPGYGEFLISQLMDVFVRYPDVWAKTVFILNYDENDGFFDHVPPPVPALDATQGASTVSTAGESFHGVPVGLGPRVPAIIISPWTKGGWVNSQVFDHTSVLRFLEARFGVAAPLVTPWRRAISGDLTSVFDFTRPDPVWTAELPNTADYLAETRHSCMLPAPQIPTHQHAPVQEAGQRPARPLPYALHADLIEPGQIRLGNSGAEGAVLRVIDATGARHFTLGAGAELNAAVQNTGVVTVHGPNGFYRAFDAAGTLLAALSVDPTLDFVTLSLSRGAGTKAASLSLRLHDAYAGTNETLVVSGDTPQVAQLPVAKQDHWYDLSIFHGKTLLAQFAGHVETGRPSRTDPLMGRGTAGVHA
ncbi:phospholipase C, phosphocholine-specific [Acetobacter sp. TBRC 12305]|uniref:phospholipase C n=1 Tax=Acetobacter garciniae TaxID=2817435 RepID=A0A939HNF2_9PROT|nr:phospholipase C, phosphocholine-specific [Acetobacter garciniae]MBO1325491.1 phospholipase C, phosphocholine-specific [Acetobacter garciniae]MBX0345337.1 phospholipase C, phosphocholine-specific [Acetobacter garciniae]